MYIMGFYVAADLTRCHHHKEKPDEKVCSSQDCLVWLSSSIYRSILVVHFITMKKLHDIKTALFDIEPVDMNDEKGEKTSYAT